MFRQGNESLIEGVLIDVAEVNVEKLHATNLLKLLLHPSPNAKSIDQGILYVSLATHCDNNR